MLKGIFSFASSVMFISIALFLYSHLHLDKKSAAQITGTYLALHYGLSLIAGYVGTHYISFKRLYVPGLIFQALGYLLLSQVQSLNELFWVLPMVLLGNMVSSVSIVEFISYSTAQYPDLQRTAMQYNYASMNLGNILGAIVSGIFSLLNQFHLVFLLLSLAPLSCALLGGRYIQYQALVASSFRYAVAVVSLLFIAVVLFSHVILIHTHQVNYLLGFTGLAIFLSILWLHRLMPAGSRTVITFILYLVVWIGFWGMFFLTPTILMIFIKDWVMLDFHGIIVQPQWLDTVDPIVVVALTPLLVYVLGKSKPWLGFTIPSFSLFGLGLMVVAMSSWGLAYSMSALSIDHKLSMVAIVLYIGGMALAEVLIGPEGYTLPGKLAPEQLRGLFTGILVASMSISSFIASSIAGHLFHFEQHHGLHAYHQAFNSISLVAGLLGVVVFLVGFLGSCFQRR